MPTLLHRWLPTLQCALQLPSLPVVLGFSMMDYVNYGLSCCLTALQNIHMENVLGASRVHHDED